MRTDLENGNPDFAPAGYTQTRFPLSEGQKALYYLYRSAPESKAYNLACAVHLRNDVDLKRLEENLHILFRRHPLLRTAYFMEDGIPYQSVNANLELPLTLSDASRWSRDDLSRALLDEAERPFDLEQGPPCRVRIFARERDGGVLLFTGHHIAIDGWSFWICLEELGLLQSMTRSSESAAYDSPLGPPGADYFEFVAGQEAMLAGPKGKKLKAYWKERLSNDPSSLNLNTDYPRNVEHAFDHASKAFRIDKELTRRLRKLARSEGVTLYTLLLAAYQVLLHRYTGQDEVLVGTPAAGRSGSTFRNTVGYFVNSLVMRGKLDDNPSFRTLLSRTHRTVRGALVHQAYPFSHIVRDLGADRDPNRAPVFQAAFVFQKPVSPDALANFAASPAAEPPFELPGLRFGPITVIQQEDQYDIALEMTKADDELPGVLKFDRSSYHPSTMERIAEHFELLLRCFTEDPDRNVDHAPLLGEEEKNRILDLGNGEETSEPEYACLHEWFEAQARLTPDSIAVLFDDRSLTYSKLNEKANRLARYLHDRGVGPDGVVGLCMDRSPEQLVGLLGILKAGGAYLPLDPSYPAERLLYMMNDARASLWLTDDQKSKSLASIEVPAFCPMEASDVLSLYSGENPLVENKPEDLLYVIYTSGSTGKPKGVAMPHAPILNLIEWQLQRPGFKKAARTLQFTSLSFDVSAQEIFTTLCSGGTLVLVDEEVRHDMERLAQHLCEHDIERLFLPFVALHHLAEAMVRSKRFPLSLKQVITAGEQLQITPGVRQMFETLRGCSLHNQYGPTETHVATAYTLDGAPGTWPELPAIGRPVANTRIRLLDERLQPVPQGVTGEIHIGGKAPARGYIHHPDLTERHFLADPFSMKSRERMYRTGDLARYAPDGNIEYLGRRDSQIKIRGFRIEPGEIESELRRHEGIDDAVVKVWDDAPASRKLVAYYTCNASSPFALNDLYIYLANRLPPYMIPSRFIPIDAIPLTSSGKKDHNALPRPEEYVVGTPLDAVRKPQNAVEELVAGIWSEVLHRDRIGRNDGFFDLGGHSLMATQVASRIRELFNVEIPLRELFRSPTVAGTARWIMKERVSVSGMSQAPPIVAVDREGDLPLSFSQERMWFLNQLNPESAAYNMGVATKLLGPFDAKAAERALTAIVKRHENLRTTFPEAHGMPVMNISEVPVLSIRTTDLRTFPADAREAEARRLAEEETRKPFDLARGPLFRVHLFRLDTEDHVVLFCMHHIISDLWTFGVLFKELAAFYSAAVTNKEEMPSPPALQYADFASWQRQWLQGDVLNEQLAYWKKRLEGISTLALPTDHPRPAVRTYRGSLQSLELPCELIETVKRKSAELGVTPFMLMLAVFKLLLHRYTGQEDLVVGSPIANRTRLSVEAMTGTFVNTLALRSDLSGDPAFRTLLERVRDAALDAYAHQDMPFEKLVEELRPDRDMSHSPLVQVMFNLANAPFDSPPIEGLAWSPLEIERKAAQFDVTLFADLEITGKIFAEYNTDLFEPETIDHMLRNYRTALEAVMADPDQRLSEVPLLADADKEKILHTWNACAAPYPKKKVFSELFEERVENSPRKIAVSLEDDSLTYDELNRRSNRLAHHLISLGAKPGLFVGLCVERSIDMVVGLLGIMKSGAAYLPLDPGFPPERLSFMMKDADAPLLVTRGRLAEGMHIDHTRPVPLDRDGEAERIEKQSEENPAQRAKPSDVAYIIYTSGSTGLPKGVQIPHGALVNFLCSMAEAPGLTSEDRLLALTTISFDIAGLELFLPLLQGGSVSLVDRETAYDGPRLVEKIKTSGATIMQATPATWRMLIDSGWTRTKGLKVLCGGEALSRELADALLDRCAEVWNMYGPTETTVWSTLSRVEPGAAPVDIGRPIANTEIYVLDRHLRPVPIGVPGELHIGGDGLALGYLNRSELTNEKFIPHPFSDAGDARIYKTGDMARYRPDGRIECLGRIDNQVKVRGFRIELGEIESALAGCPGVSEAVVKAVEDVSGHKRLVAYIVPEAGHEPSPTDLRPHLKKSLPDYMLPTAWVLLDRFPLTPNGKVDRKTLPPPNEKGPGNPHAYRAPRTPMEKKLAGIWADVLQIERVGLDEDFFDLGGHSLLATRLIARIRSELNMEIPLRALFIDPFVEGLARKITYSARTDRYQYHEEAFQWTSLRCMQARGERPAFYLVSGTYSKEDEFLGYMSNLVPYMGNDQPVFGFQARGLDGLQAPHASAEEMAHDYIEELRAYQPRGPYLLGGECVGGTVAFEMARQLESQNEEVALLVLLDTVCPTWRSAFLFHLDFLYRKLRSIGKHVKKIFQRDPRKGKAHLIELFRRKRKLYYPANDEERTEAQIYRIERTYSRTMFKYRPKPISGKVTLIVNEEAFKRNPSLGWDRICGERIELHAVPGNHLTRITDFVQDTAARIRSCIDGALDLRNGDPGEGGDRA